MFLFVCQDNDYDTKDASQQDHRQNVTKQNPKF